MSFTPTNEPSVVQQPTPSATIAPIATSILVSLATTPWLLTIVAIRATEKLLERTGVASEEIFRGDRLPVIHFPTDNL